MNFKKNKGSVLITLIIVLVIVILIIVGLFFYLWPKVKITRPGSSSESGKPEWFKTKEEIKEIIATVAPVPDINFTDDGHLIKRGTGTETESWTFLYEGPGAPAQTANLIFKHFSLCDSGSGEKNCQINLQNFESGTRVNIKGNKEDQTVTVIKLKRI